MTDYGLTLAGFVKKPLEQILTDIGERQRAEFGAALDTSPATALGQMNGTYASGLAEVWELAEAAHHGADPDAAAGYLLTALSGLTGTTRRGATASVSKRQQLSLNAGATVPAGSLISYLGRPDIVFATDVAVTNPGASAALFLVTATCTKTGVVSAPGGLLTVIVNAVSGWTATTNLQDAIVGRDVDNDIVLRQRREDQLALRGGSTLLAIKADLLDVENHQELKNIRTVFGIENTADTTDPVTGLLPHSFEMVIDDGDTPGTLNVDIAQAIFESKPAGIATVGTVYSTATDANGDAQLVRFSRPTLKPVYISLTKTVSADYPADGDLQIKAAIVAAGLAYGIGDTVIALHLRAAALAVKGVLDVPVFTLGFAASPVGVINLDPGLRGRATFSTTNISVT